MIQLTRPLRAIAIAGALLAGWVSRMLRTHLRAQLEPPVTGRI